MHNCQKIHQVYLVKNTIKTLNLFFFKFAHMLVFHVNKSQQNGSDFRFENETCNIDCMLKLLIH